LFAAAGLERVKECDIVIRQVIAGFEDWSSPWAAFLCGGGALGEWQEGAPSVTLHCSLQEIR
jgi:hypothetical protein